ncbi:hypothetical protein COY95_00235 [Candidatus Woesearchaeota archaeon CG_4_10_14_0_8_um_filter_47_5]|nr:MAG: hypothetical protein COY95_00235 [Candidatus Woesearchaeota archaeon CG_4_10_14_0_8_um_filter_47_5]
MQSLDALVEDVRAAGQSVGQYAHNAATHIRNNRNNIRRYVVAAAVIGAAVIGAIGVPAYDIMTNPGQYTPVAPYSEVGNGAYTDKKDPTDQTPVRTDEKHMWDFNLIPDSKQGLNVP